MPEKQKPFIPQWGTSPVPLEDQEVEIKKQLDVLDGLRIEAEAGRIAAFSLVIVRPNFVPEHVFSAAPYSAAMLLVGMEMAADDLKYKARQMPVGPTSTPEDQYFKPSPPPSDKEK